MPAATDIMTPLWRGVVALRIITAGFAVAAIIVHHGGFDRPDLGWAALVGIVGWTVLTSLAYSYDQTRCGHVIVIDLLVTPRVEVSVPGTAVMLPVGDVEELIAVVREALANTARHGGLDAKSWVLVEDLDA